MTFAHAMDGKEAQTIVIAHTVRIGSWSNIIGLYSRSPKLDKIVNSTCGTFLIPHFSEIMDQLMIFCQLNLLMG